MVINNFFFAYFDLKIINMNIVNENYDKSLTKIYNELLMFFYCWHLLRWNFHVPLIMFWYKTMKISFLQITGYCNNLGNKKVNFLLIWLSKKRKNNNNEMYFELYVLIIEYFHIIKIKKINCTKFELNITLYSSTAASKNRPSIKDTISVLHTDNKN